MEPLPGPDRAAPPPESDGLPTLEARLRRLEEIVSALEADDVALERALALFEEGIRHVREAERVLADTELRVEELLAEGNTRPLTGGNE